jgi:hypothetical protein
LSYTNLILKPQDSILAIDILKREDVVKFLAKDIFRASELPLLDEGNYHVQKDIQKIKKGIKLSPILLYQFKSKLIIADGYHRLCAVYQFNEDAEIPCKIIY